jgi:DNA-binding NarL/FixJ family response regulator
MYDLSIATEPVPVTLVLIDDDVLVRAGLKALLESDPRLRIVGEAQGPDEALRIIASTQPQIALVDLCLPEADGIQLASLIRRHHPSVKCVILTGFPDERYRRKASEAGAVGYVLKSEIEKLEEVVLTAASSEPGSELPSIQMEDTGSGSMPALTARQCQVLQHIADGMTNKETAFAMRIAVKTVEKHRAELMRKLDVHNTAGLVSFAFTHRMQLMKYAELPKSLMASRDTAEALHNTE